MQDIRAFLGLKYRFCDSSYSYRYSAVGKIKLSINLAKRNWTVCSGKGTVFVIEACPNTSFYYIREPVCLEARTICSVV